MRRWSTTGTRSEAAVSSTRCRAVPARASSSAGSFLTSSSRASFSAAMRRSTAASPTACSRIGAPVARWSITSRANRRAHRSAAPTPHAHGRSSTASSGPNGGCGAPRSPSDNCWSWSPMSSTSSGAASRRGARRVPDSSASVRASRIRPAMRPSQYVGSSVVALSTSFVPASGVLGPWAVAQKSRTDCCWAFAVNSRSRISAMSSRKSDSLGKRRALPMTAVQAGPEAASAAGSTSPVRVPRGRDDVDQQPLHVGVRSPAGDLVQHRPEGGVVEDAAVGQPGRGVGPPLGLRPHRRAEHVVGLGEPARRRPGTTTRRGSPGRVPPSRRRTRSAAAARRRPRRRRTRRARRRSGTGSGAGDPARGTPGRTHRGISSSDSPRAVAVTKSVTGSSVGSVRRRFFSRSTASSVSTMTLARCPPSSSDRGWPSSCSGRSFQPGLVLPQPSQQGNPPLLVGPVESPPAGGRRGQQRAVDASGAGPGHDVDHDAAVGRRVPPALPQVPVVRRDVGLGRGAARRRAAQEVDLVRHAGHPHREADAAVHDAGDPQLGPVRARHGGGSS